MGPPNSGENMGSSAGCEHALSTAAVGRISPDAVPPSPYSEIAPKLGQGISRKIEKSYRCRIRWLQEYSKKTKMP
jgi:hypothetical protein